MKEIFIKFLEEKGVKEQYFKNFNTELAFDDLSPEWYFLLPFCWADTEEGDDFWDVLDDQWLELIGHV